MRGAGAARTGSLPSREQSTWPQAIPAVAVWAGMNVLALVIGVRWLSGAAVVQLAAMQLHVCVVMALTLNLFAWFYLRWGWQTAPGRGAQRLMMLASLHPLLVLAGCARTPGQFYVTCLACLLTLVIGELSCPATRLAPFNCDTDERMNAASTSRQDSGFSQADALINGPQRGDPVSTGAFFPGQDLRLRRERIAPLVDCLTPVPLPNESPADLNTDGADEDPEGEAPEAAMAGAGHWMQRHTTDDGQEQIQGGVVVPFAAGQKQANVHLAFCPPLSATPEVVCDCDSSACRFKVAAVYPYGVRIEMKRTDDCRQSVEIRLSYATVRLQQVSAA